MHNILEIGKVVRREVLTGAVSTNIKIVRFDREFSTLNMHVSELKSVKAQASEGISFPTRLGTLAASQTNLYFGLFLGSFQSIVCIIYNHNDNWIRCLPDEIRAHVPRNCSTTLA